MIRVEADVLHTKGTLAGIVSPSGFSVTVPDEETAIRISAWINSVRASDDFIRSNGLPRKFASGARVVRFPENGVV